MHIRLLQRFGSKESTLFSVLAVMQRPALTSMKENGPQGLCALPL